MLVKVRKRLRRHFERLADDVPADKLRLTQLSQDEYGALARLTGRTPRFSSSMLLDIAEIDEALNIAGIAKSLRFALEQLDGPIINKALANAEKIKIWSDAITHCQNVQLAAYLNTASGLSVLKRLSRQNPQMANEQIQRADTVLQRLPAGGVPRSQLAAETLGDAHALDTGQPIATLVIAACRRRNEFSRIEEDDFDPETPYANEETIRNVWARAGVLVNELAKPALYLNLTSQNRGEPQYISLRKLLRSTEIWEVNQRNVYVCENPNLLAIAADRLGVQCVPMVCTDGMPAAAQNVLMGQLKQAGARLFYHGDFDWPGIHIANYVIATHGAIPWRLSALDYETSIPKETFQQHQLRGGPVSASWDGLLTATMARHGIAIAEEALSNSLITDLQAPKHRP